MHMRCVVSNCQNDSRNVSSKRITFHKFPIDSFLRAAWLTALDKEGWQPAEGSAVCSDHFLENDLFTTRSGLCRVKADAVPVIDVKVCCICLATECKIYSMIEDEDLAQAYQTLTGLTGEGAARDVANVCRQCARALRGAARLRARSLRTHAALLSLLDVQGRVTLESIKYIEHIAKETVFSSNKCSSEIYSDALTHNNVISGDIIKSEDSIITNQEQPSDDLVDDINMKDERITYEHFYEDTTEDDNSKLFNFHDEDTVNVKAEQDEGQYINNSDNLNCDNEDADPSSNGSNRDGDIYLGEDYSSVGSQPASVERGVSERDVSTVEQARNILTVAKTPSEPDPIVLAKSEQDKPSHGIRATKRSVTYTCDICKKMFSYKNDIRSHLRSHSNKKPYPCDICKKVTSSKYNLETHMKTHLTIHSCHICGKVFDKEYKLCYHLRVHSVERPYSCDICKKAFKTKNSIRIHLQCVHSTDPKYSCKICNKAFFHKTSIQSHLLTHSDEKPYSCNICKQTFKRKSFIFIHLLKHSGHVPYSCDICKRSFTGKGHLRRHISIDHSFKKPMCHICGKIYSKNAYLKVHLRTHTGEKPYSCDICKKAFIRKERLIIHLRVHSGERPYSCHVCKKGFSQSWDLKRHLRIHSGEKPYTCDVCGVSFTLNDHLQKHLRTHSGKK